MALGWDGGMTSLLPRIAVDVENKERRMMERSMTFGAGHGGPGARQDAIHQIVELAPEHGLPA